jgi:rhamnosyltransferase
MCRYGARVIPIDAQDFDHGLTRDLGAEHARGRILVFLNQDAVPADDRWLERLTRPLFERSDRVAVQGGIAELPDPRERFYWDSCGDRFYFTSESRRWLDSFFGIGFSTVNAAIRRDVWERFRFGRAPIMEDKKWQREVVTAGGVIAVVPEALVHHTHRYGFGSLCRRCAREGFGWRWLGHRYSAADMMADLMQPRVLADLLRGLVRRRVRTVAELLFPWLRPVFLYVGNRGWWAAGLSEGPDSDLAVNRKEANRTPEYGGDTSEPARALGASPAESPAASATDSEHTTDPSPTTARKGASLPRF